MAATLRVMAHDKGLALELQAAEGMPQALSLDAFRVRQVLINLLGNAIKFTAQGKVTLAAQWQARRAALRSARYRARHPGRQPAKRIFQPFQRAPGVTAAGTGLGLSITRKLVELMGGTISARSQPGQGSVFEMRIPAPEAALAGAGAGESRRRRRRRNFPDACCSRTTTRICATS